MYTCLEEAIALAAVYMDNYSTRRIWKQSQSLEFFVILRWLGYEEGNDTLLSWATVKDLEALQVYAKMNRIKLPD
jgi:hypothetical protein